jgi:Major tropism determinant N-terminal domain
MSVQVKRRRDTAANIAAFTPAQGEIIVDTTNNRMIVGDGATAGGFSAAKPSEVLTGTTALTQVAQGPNGAAIQFQVIEQTVTLSGASTVAGAPIPANCIVFAVGMRVLTAVTGAPSFGVGVSGNATQFGGALNVAAGSTNYGIIGPIGVYLATNLIVTATSGSFTGGQLRLSLKIMLVQPSS